MAEARRKSSAGDNDYRAMTDNDARDPADTKWSFNFKRLTAIVILTFLLTIFALIYDQLSIAIKRVESESIEDDETSTGWCKVHGVCGWRVGEYTYKGSGTYPNCPTIDKKTYNIDYSHYCNKNSKTYSDDCDAMDAGNVYLAFSIISLISLLLLMLIFIPACFKKRIVTESIQKRIRIILIILFLIAWICEFIAAFVWLFMSLCDEADIYYSGIFYEDTANSFGVSTGCLLICFVANLVGFGAVAFCWSDYTELTQNYDPDQNL